MKRRNFLQGLGLAGIAAPLLQSCTTPQENKLTTETAWVDNFDLNEVTIDQLQQKMASGELTARSLAELYIKRITSIDKSGPTINSIIELNPDV